MGEKSSKYFLNLEKHNYNKKALLRLRLDNGKIIQHQPAILQEQMKFYKKKFVHYKFTRISGILFKYVTVT